MALDYGTILPAQTDTDPSAYPQGKAKNVTVPGAGDGTPWYADLVNDLIFGPMQRFLKLTGTVPSGTPDTADDSQHVDAMQRWLWGTLISSNWEAPVPGSLTGDLNCIAYSPTLDLWVALGENGVLRYSTDLRSWTSSTIGGGTPDFNAVCWSASMARFVAVGDAGAIYTSADGIAWSSQTSGTTTDLYDVAVKPGTPDTIFAVGEASLIDAQPNGIYSTNGTVWTPSDVPFGAGVKSVCWAAGLNAFVCMVSGGGVATSPTGAAWSTAGLVASGQALARKIVWSAFHSRVIAVGNGGLVSSSADLVTWDEVTGVLGGTTLYAVAVDENLGQVVAVGANGIAAAFDPGGTWYNRVTRASINHLGTAFSAAQGIMAIVGPSGGVLQSLRGLHA